MKTRYDDEAWIVADEHAWDDDRLGDTQMEADDALVTWAIRLAELAEADADLWSTLTSKHLLGAEAAETVKTVLDAAHRAAVVGRAYQLLDPVERAESGVEKDG